MTEKERRERRRRLAEQSAALYGRAVREALQLPARRSQGGLREQLDGPGDSDSEEEEEVDGLDEVPEARAGRSFLDLYDEAGCSMLSVTIWERDFAFHPMLKGWKLGYWHETVLQILLSTDETLLRVILDGNLQRARRTDPVLRRSTLNDVKARCERENMPLEYM